MREYTMRYLFLCVLFITLLVHLSQKRTSKSHTDYSNRALCETCTNNNNTETEVKVAEKKGLILTDDVAESAFDSTEGGHEEELTTARKDNYELYNTQYHEIRLGMEKGHKKQRKAYGMKFFPELLHLYPKKKYKVWFDAGCGECGIVKYLLKSGYDAYGSDVSTTNLEKNCNSLFQSGRVSAASLQNLPFESDKFDIIFSADVLEHIPDIDIPYVIQELVRVSKTGVLFLSISQRLSGLDPDPPGLALFHITLKPRSWWDEKFRAMKCYRNKAVLKRFQKRLPTEVRGRLKEKMSRTKPGREFWNDAGELEPWVFPYKCRKP